jgi:hypothetical protein
MTNSADLFDLLAPDERLDPRFVELRGSRGHAPARAMMAATYRDMGDRDGNFRQQFQTDGFDARTWELYLFAAFRELGFEIDLSWPAPDFLLRQGGLTVAVEATTANAPDGYPAASAPDDLAERRRYVEEELPIRLGSPLFSKLRRRHWELEHVRGHPYLVAIESFVSGDSLQFAETALTDFLFGLRATGERRADGGLEVETTTIEEHRGSKVLESGFFNWPDADNIAAVLWSNSGTVGKFGRIAFQGGLASSGLRMRRAGLRFVPDPDAAEPTEFEYEVGTRREPWAEGLVVIHNPTAVKPLPQGWMPELVRHELDGGQVVTTVPGFHAFTSWTVTEVQQG